MTDILVVDSQLEANKNFAWWLYLGHGASMFFTLGLLSFVPLIFNYLQRDKTAGTFVHSHHTWMIRSFWWYTVWVVLGVFLALTLIGIPLAWLVFSIAWLWKAYRLIKGISDLNANRPELV